MRAASSLPARLLTIPIACLSSDQIRDGASTCPAPPPPAGAIVRLLLLLWDELRLLRADATICASLSDVRRRRSPGRRAWPFPSIPSRGPLAFCCSWPDFWFWARSQRGRGGRSPISPWPSRTPANARRTAAARPRGRWTAAEWISPSSRRGCRRPLASWRYRTTKSRRYAWSTCRTCTCSRLSTCRTTGSPPTLHLGWHGGMEDEGFEMLEELAYLYLANNQLTSAPKALPPSLVSADFAANQLTKIFPYTFGYKPNLKSVYLHNNKLTDGGLPNHMFNDSDNLEILTMSSNFLRTVPKNLPPSLYRLHLKSNKLEEIPAGAFDSLQNLRELYLQNNLLSNEGMDNETFGQLNSLECLDLSNNNLSMVPKGLPRNLVLLHLEKNSIQSIPADALISVRNLEYLLLHNNKLRSRFIHPAAFQGLKKLHTLHMYNNQLERVPRGLPRRAKTLVLLHNSISEIGRNDLALLYTLTELNLSYNQLSNTKLHREAFRKLRLLETLHLSGNALRSLPVGLPRSLKVLEVKNNQLGSIPDGALTGMDKLQKLILSENQLRLNSVYQGAWMELSALTTLDLSNNQLSHVPSDLPESLEYLYLQRNRIASIPASAFEGTPNIKGIFLRFNRLLASAVDESSLAHLSQLQVLDIGGGGAGAAGADAGEEDEESK